MPTVYWHPTAASPQVCAGLRQFLPSEALSGALVCVVANLKPAKLAGEASEAMVLAAGEWCWGAGES